MPRAAYALTRALRSAAHPLTLAIWTSLLGAPGCAHRTELRSASERPAVAGLRYTLQIDATRLTRGTGLPPVAAVAQLVEDNLLRFFRLRGDQPPGDAVRREMLAESPAPGYAVRVLIEARPDDYCLVGLETVQLREGQPSTAVTLVPYSVHHALQAIRASLAALRTVPRPPLSPDRFETLRKQASELAARGEDPPIDDATFARTPRPLEKMDEPARYYAPSQTESTLRR
jgi:hypothetical protein